MPACRANDTDQIKFFIDEGVDPTLEDASQWSALIWAACHGNLDLTKYLIEQNAHHVYSNKPIVAEAPTDQQTDGAEVTEVAPVVVKRKKKKHSPLHWAAFKGHLKTVWLLLGLAELDPNDRDAIGNTVLHQAAAGGHLDVVLCLLAQVSILYCILSLKRT